jgi:hypothetical protein
MAHPSQEREEMRIENAVIYHGAKLVVRATHAKCQVVKQPWPFPYMSRSRPGILK